MNATEKILLGIQPGCLFDSHYVTGQMIKDHSDDYLSIAQSIDPATKDLTLSVSHQQKWHRLKDLVRRGFQAVSWG